MERKVNQDSLLQFANHQGTISLLVYENGMSVEPIAGEINTGIQFPEN